MSKYLQKKKIIELNEARKQICELRKKYFDELYIDILENDTVSNLSIYNIISVYDNDFNINFARNGEDASSSEIDIELKTRKVKKLKVKSGYEATKWGFHAEGLLKHKRYIFVSRCKNTLIPCKIYDVSNPENINEIHEELLKSRTAWRQKPKTKNGFDMIHVKEILLKSMKPIDKKNIDECEVIIL